MEQSVYTIFRATLSLQFTHIVRSWPGAWPWPWSATAALFGQWDGGGGGETKMLFSKVVLGKI